MIERKQAR